tara:strand:- start:6342 stop:6902 length:561 start_codon:yes stop_codon:yes gene_type:complete
MYARDGARILWQFPFKSFVLFFITLNFTLFLLHRAILFVELYSSEAQSAKEHSYVATQICSNITLRAGLGVNYIDICHSAEEFANRLVFLVALKRTMQSIHLCGDIPCLELLDQLLEILTRSLAFTMGAVLVAVVVVLIGVLYCCGSGVRRRRRHEDVRSVHSDQQEFDPLTLNDLDDNYDAKKFV